jgi:hypothetical protein
MIEFQNFSLGLKFEETDAEIGKDFMFKGLDILETMNQVPYFELGLESNFIDPIQKEKNITLEYQSNELNYTSKLGINSVVFNGKSLLIRGWLTDWENFKIPNTRYLGNNIKTGLEKLNIKDTINYSDNLTGELFQINQTNLQQCLDLCTAGSKHPYWSIGRYAINLDEFVEESEVNARTGGEVIITSLSDLSPTYTDSMSSWFQGASYLNRYLAYDYDQKDQLYNLLKNKKIQDLGFKYSMIADCNQEYEFPVGSKLKNTNDIYSEVTDWIVVSVYYHYRQNAVGCNIQYGGLI